MFDDDPETSVPCWPDGTERTAQSAGDGRYGNSGTVVVVSRYDPIPSPADTGERVVTPEEAIAGAWYGFLASDEHLDRCASWQEGRFCCAEPDAPASPDDWHRYNGKQRRLIELALSALEREGFLARAAT